MNELNGILAIVGIVGQLLFDGRTTYDRIKGALATLGATPEELAALDVRLTDAIAAREAEHGKLPPA